VVCWLRLYNASGGPASILSTALNAPSYDVASFRAHSLQVTFRGKPRKVFEAPTFPPANCFFLVHNSKYNTLNLMGLDRGLAIVI